MEWDWCPSPLHCEANIKPREGVGFSTESITLMKERCCGTSSYEALVLPDLLRGVVTWLVPFNLELPYASLRALWSVSSPQEHAAGTVAHRSLMQFINGFENQGQSFTLEDDWEPGEDLNLGLLWWWWPKPMMANQPQHHKHMNHRGQVLTQSKGNFS